MSSPTLFTAVSAYSLAGVAAMAGVAYAGAQKLLPANASQKDKFTFIWLAFDALIHFSFEGSFLWLSVFGRTVFNSTGVFAELWKEYAQADYRWGVADPTVVSLEILTVLGVGPLCCLVLWQLIKGDNARHYWIVVLSTSELYGGWMTFSPEWLVGSPNLDTSNWLFLWVYLFFMNTLWVIIPLWLLYDSYGAIASSLRQAKPAATAQKKSA